MTTLLLPNAGQGLLPELKLLVRCGASVNACDYDARTCLHLAASEGSLAAAAFLISAGAKINARDRWGGTRTAKRGAPPGGAQLGPHAPLVPPGAGMHAAMRPAQRLHLDRL